MTAGIVLETHRFKWLNWFALNNDTKIELSDEPNMVKYAKVYMRWLARGKALELTQKYKTIRENKNEFSLRRHL